MVNTTWYLLIIMSIYGANDKTDMARKTSYLVILSLILDVVKYLVA